MRSSDEQLREIQKRSARLRAQAASRRMATVSALGAAACLVLLVLVARTIPGLDTTPVQIGQQPYASLVLAGPLASLVVICVLSFLMGVCFTLLCIHLRNLRRR